MKKNYLIPDLEIDRVTLSELLTVSNVEDLNLRDADNEDFWA